MITVALFLLVAIFAVASENAVAQNLPQSRSATSNWIISETSSPVDYQPVVVATAQSRDSAPGSEMRLSISCRNGRTELLVAGQTISGRADDYAISYRVNEDSLTEVGARSLAFGTGAGFRGDIVRFLRSLPDEGEIVISLAARTGTVREAHFLLSGLSTVRTKLATACKWPPADTSPATVR